jgi:hypothetical protein
MTKAIFSFDCGETTCFSDKIICRFLRSGSYGKRHCQLFGRELVEEPEVPNRLANCLALSQPLGSNPVGAELWIETKNIVLTWCQKPDNFRDVIKDIESWTKAKEDPFVVELKDWIYADSDRIFCSELADAIERLWREYWAKESKTMESK